MSKNLQISYLLDFYGDMLTDKQQEVMEQYYNDDLSLAEIAANLGITRQGVRDSIKRGEGILLELEQKVGFAGRYRAVSEGLMQLQKLARNIRFVNSTAYTFSDEIDKDSKEMLRILDELQGQEVMDSLTPAQQVVKIVNEELTNLMGGQEAARIHIKNKGQTVIMMCGLQGNGKTTHAAKLAKYFLKEGRRPLLVACDVYRPAAIDQLQVLGEQIHVPVFTMGTEKPPVIAQKALARARDYGNDIVILDTAGRLQIDEQLMQELVDIKQAVQVDETLLVVDAMAGQDAVNVAKTFHEKIGVDGIVLTKTDGDTRGGAALSVLAVTGKPIKFQGTGEKLDDLEVFHPGRMAGRILGMGDVLSLIEKAQETADQEAAEKTARRMMENKFDMNDMLDQFAQMKKMGGISAMLSMIPGGNKVDPSQIDEKQFVHIEAIIQSMTPAEREKPSIINPKRKRRIAAGSGTSVEEVNKLLRQFEMMQKMMKKVKRNPKGFARSLGLGRGMPGGMGF